MKISHLLLASMVVCSGASFAEQNVSEFNAEKSASPSTLLDENKLSSAENLAPSRDKDKRRQRRQKRKQRNMGSCGLG